MKAIKGRLAARAQVQKHFHRCAAAPVTIAVSGWFLRGPP